MIVASAEGFDTAHHLGIKMVALQNANLAVAGVTNNSLQIGTSSVSNPMAADAAGSNLKIIDGFYPYNIYSLIGSKQLSVSDSSYPAVMKSLAGKTIGVSVLAGATYVMAKALLQGAGMSGTSVNFTAVGAVPTGYAALQQNRISAYVGYQPLPAICEVENTCTELVNLQAGEGPSSLNNLNGAFQVYWASQSYMQAHPQVISDFVAMVSQTIAWMHDPANLQTLLSIAEKDVKVGSSGNSTAIITSMINSDLKYFQAGVNRSSVDAWSNFLYTNGLMKARVPSSEVVWPEAPTFSG